MWKEGKYFDTWSITHLLSGFVFGGWLFEFGLSVTEVVVIYSILAVGWEIYEIISGIEESIGNRAVDLVVAYIGLVGVLGLPISASTLAIASLVYLFLEIHGYLSYSHK